MKTIRATVLVILHAALAGGVAAQDVQGPPCGDREDAQAWAEALEVILQSPDYADFRVANGLPVQGAEPEAVSTQGECARVATDLRRYLRQRDDWAELQRDGYTWVVVRAGDRYLVPIRFGAGRNTELAHGGHTLVLVFADGEVAGSFLR